MAIKKFENKDLRSIPEVKIEDKEDEYFFPNIDGHSITVKAASPDEAERKAKAIINKL